MLKKGNIFMEKKQQNELNIIVHRQGSVSLLISST